MKIYSSCTDCGNYQTANINQCDCGNTELARDGDYVSIHSQGELVHGEVKGFKINSSNNRAMVVIEPDCSDHDTQYFTHEIDEILI